MKKYIYGLMALTTLLVACKPKNEVVNIEKSSIVGKWKITQQGNLPVLTDNRIVFTFNADGTGKQTLAADLGNIGEKAWYMEQRMKYTLNGNALYTQWTNSSVVLEWLASIAEMTDQQFIAEPSRALLQTEPLADMPQTVWQRVNVDYTDGIIGLWEGTSSEGITYGDHNHRWLFTPGGQYFYYSPNDTAGWGISDNGLNEYDVDGDYLAFRWKETSTAAENREFWDITVQDKSMAWTALREDATSQYYNASFTMRRVSPTQGEAETYLPGKWIAVKADGKDILTDEKSVHTFDGGGNVYYTVADTTAVMHEWHNRLRLNYTISGNYLVEKGVDNAKDTVQWRSSLAQMDNENLTVYAFSSTRDTEGNTPYREITLQKVLVDYKNDILGRWEGIDGNDNFEHQWEYLAEDKNGISHFNYYTFSTDSGKWITTDDVPGEYMVDGNWMATRWVLNDTIHYEWWDLEINGDIMNWTGLRKDGVTKWIKLKRLE